MKLRASNFAAMVTLTAFSLNFATAAYAQVANDGGYNLILGSQPTGTGQVTTIGGQGTFINGVWIGPTPYMCIGPTFNMVCQGCPTKELTNECFQASENFCDGLISWPQLEYGIGAQCGFK